MQAIDSLALSAPLDLDMTLIPSETQPLRERLIEERDEPTPESVQPPLLQPNPLLDDWWTGGRTAHAPIPVVDSASSVEESPPVPQLTPSKPQLAEAEDRASVPSRQSPASQAMEPAVVESASAPERHRSTRAGVATETRQTKLPNIQSPETREGRPHDGERFMSLSSNRLAAMLMEIQTSLIAPQPSATDNWDRKPIAFDRPGYPKGQVSVVMSTLGNPRMCTSHAQPVATPMSFEIAYEPRASRVIASGQSSRTAGPVLTDWGVAQRSEQARPMAVPQWKDDTASLSNMAVASADSAVEQPTTGDKIIMASPFGVYLHDRQPSIEKQSPVAIRQRQAAPPEQPGLVDSEAGESGKSGSLTYHFHSWGAGYSVRLDLDAVLGGTELTLVPSSAGVQSVLNDYLGHFPLDDWRWSPGKEDEGHEEHPEEQAEQEENTDE